MKGIKAIVLCSIIFMAFSAALISSSAPAYAAGTGIRVVNTVTGSNVTLASLHDSFSVKVAIENAPNDLAGYQFTLFWNASIINCTGFKDTPPTAWGGNVYEPVSNITTYANHTACYQNAILCMVYPVGAPGNYTVTTLNFTVIAEGESPFEFHEVTLGTWGLENVPTTVTSGFFITLIRNAAVVDVKPWSSKILQNVSTNIDVTVKNKGNSPSSFSVFTYYNSSSGFVGLIGKQEVADLAGNSYQNVTFLWDTKGMSLGTYVIFANMTGGQRDTRLVGGTIEIQNEPDHDIALNRFVSNASGLVEPEVACMTMEVQNQGNMNEDNCTLELAYNDSLSPLKTVPEILAGGVFSYLYNWSSVGKSGNNLFTANVSLKTGETDGNPENNQKNLTIVVSRSSPIANFTVSPDKPGVLQEVTFDASSSTDPLGTIANYTWDFGDSTYFGHGVTVKHIYTAAGNYTVKLTIADTKGLKYDTSRPLTRFCLAQKNITIQPTAASVISDSMLTSVAIVVIIIEILSLIVITRHKKKMPSQR